MRIETLSVFPQMFEPAMSLSIIGRARAAGILDFVAHDLRDWTHDRHNTTDDTPYGGGQGQLMKVEPVFEALDDLTGAEPAFVVFLVPQGIPFTQEIATKLATRERLIMVCGRYEGFDERVYTRADLCLSVGDYILTGGELPAMVVTDALIRLVPGVLGDALSSVDESFTAGLLEYPQYTRPATYRGLDVPDVLLGGNHALIADWQRKQSIIRTAQLRPDLLTSADLTSAERMMAGEALRETQTVHHMQTEPVGEDRLGEDDQRQ
ncbi:MAG: tRNA (guanosine(37)-N1)-methyltransferase TrmD [Coriobacteriales bacterium]|jgi:tRNA (guanine37-N1)-methyltransferase|nr:tRNA (guanosine(37)-N1)-methyltransferase TrmD [Coriobacteriales bacterium]